MALATLGKTVGRMFSDRGPQRRLLLGAPPLMARVDRIAGNFFAGCLAQACQHEAPNDVRAPGCTRQRPWMRGKLPCMTEKASATAGWVIEVVTVKHGGGPPSFKYFNVAIAGRPYDYSSPTR
jgi:hypothetical protein